MLTARQLSRSLKRISTRPSTELSFVSARSQRCPGRTYSIASEESHSKTTPNSEDGLFQANQKSVWDHVFSDIKDTPPLLIPNPSRKVNQRSRPRRQTMTAREIDAFDDMFDMIFDAVSHNTKADTPKTDVDLGRAGLGDIFNKLRKHSRRMKWTTETDSLLDKKKEEMDLCDTDQQLLTWAMKEFEESERLEKEARDALSAAEKEKRPAKDIPMLQSPTYPHIIALLMRQFRDKYKDPNLALVIFDHARHLSMASYVFGCTTMTYNELIETRWSCFRDVKGVHDALVDMNVNGVPHDSRTIALIDTMRRQVAENKLWAVEDVMGNNEIFALLSKIEKLMARSEKAQKVVEHSRSKPSKKFNSWKLQDMEDDDDDTWGFDKWDANGI